MTNSTIKVVVVYAPAPRQLEQITLTLDEGATVRDAVKASGLQSKYPDLALSRDAVGIWGRKAAPDQLLQEGDRVELWRPLLVDPKVARRERFGSQGARTAGLFAKRRPGSKQGY